MAADIDRIDEYLVKLDKGMLRYGMQSGYAAFIFKTPKNNMGQMHLVVQDLLKTRIPETKEMDRGSPAYQTALDDIRGVCRELDINSYAFQFRLRHDIAWIYFGLIGTLIFGSIGIVAMWGIMHSTVLELLISLMIALVMLAAL